MPEISFHHTVTAQSDSRVDPPRALRRRLQGHTHSLTHSVTHSLTQRAMRCDACQSVMCLFVCLFALVVLVASCGHQLEYSSLMNRMHYDESESTGDSDAASMTDNGQLGGCGGCGGGAEGDMGITAEGVNVMEIAHKLIHLVSEGMEQSICLPLSLASFVCGFGCGVQVIHSQHLDDPDVRSKLLETTQVRRAIHTQEQASCSSHWLCFPRRLCVLCVCSKRVRRTCCGTDTAAPPDRSTTPSMTPTPTPTPTQTDRQ